MASLPLSPVRARDREMTILSGSITMASADSVVSSQNFFGATFAKSAQGIWTVTLEGKYARLVGISVTEVGALATTNMNWTVASEAVASAGTISLTAARIGTPQTAQHPAAGAVFLVTIFLKNTSSK